ncbi:MAG: hypothetical protein ABJA87_06620 [bacterium]
MADVSPEAVARAEQTVAAAPVFAANAEVIAARTPDLPEGHVLVAVVDAEPSFSGMHVVARASLVATVPGLEGDGWAMVFSHTSDAEQVRHRAAEMASIAAKRIEMIRRLRARQN